MAELTKWIEQNKYHQISKEVTEYTHLLFSGGKIYIPRNKEYEFLSKYAAEVDKKSKLYYIEQRPKTYKFMIDIDMTDDHYWTFDEIVILIKNIQLIVRDFFKEEYNTICCISAEKKKEGKICTGIHLIWPGIVVSSEIALIIRSGIIQKLKKSSIILNTCTNWEKVIDELIYTRVGYRMVYSDKMSGGVSENRPLLLLFVMNAEGELNDIYYNRLLNNTKSLVLETSIRYVIDTYLEKGMDIVLPQWLEGDIVMSTPKKYGGITGTIATNKEHHIIEQFIRKNLPKEYNRSSIISVTKYTDGNLLIKTNSKYCMNIDKNHNSCGIYFFASVFGMYQKCHCNCNKLTGRKKGYCKDYSSDCFPFSDEIKNFLFPDQSKNLFKEKKKNINKFVPVSKYKDTQKQICEKLLKELLA